MPPKVALISHTKADDLGFFSYPINTFKKIKNYLSQFLKSRYKAAIQMLRKTEPNIEKTEPKSTQERKHLSTKIFKFENDEENQTDGEFENKQYSNKGIQAEMPQKNKILIDKEIQVIFAFPQKQPQQKSKSSSSKPSCLGKSTQVQTIDFDVDFQPIQMNQITIHASGSKRRKLNEDDSAKTKVRFIDVEPVTVQEHFNRQCNKALILSMNSDLDRLKERKYRLEKREEAQKKFQELSQHPNKQNLAKIKQLQKTYNKTRENIIKEKKTKIENKKRQRKNEEQISATFNVEKVLSTSDQICKNMMKEKLVKQAQQRKKIEEEKNIKKLQEQKKQEELKRQELLRRQEEVKKQNEEKKQEQLRKKEEQKINVRKEEEEAEKEKKREISIQLQNDKKIEESKPQIQSSNTQINKQIKKPFNPFLRERTPEKNHNPLDQVSSALSKQMSVYSFGKETNQKEKEQNNEVSLPTESKFNPYTNIVSGSLPKLHQLVTSKNAFNIFAASSQKKGQAVNPASTFSFQQKEKPSIQFNRFTGQPSIFNKLAPSFNQNSSEIIDHPPTSLQSSNNPIHSNQHPQFPAYSGFQTQNQPQATPHMVSNIFNTNNQNAASLFSHPKDSVNQFMMSSQNQSQSSLFSLPPPKKFEKHGHHQSRGNNRDKRRGKPEIRIT